ncbi:MAG: chemotaxis protein CheW [Deltaproteobacteria bacterium]|nr:chemotaxis protein CheW [Deltaproteobacteria bacterium]
MGRLAEARKRARNRKQKEPAASPPSPPPAPEPASASKAGDVKITLPSSALAADILQRPEAAAIEPAGPEVSSAPAEVSPSEEPARAPNLSFFSAPRRDEQKAVEATEHVATFFLSKEEYGVDVRLVQEIIRVTDITQVPRAPEFIKGVINLRGRIIPVVDLKRKLGLGEVVTSRQIRIVVVEVRDRLIGLLVDGASQVLKLPVSSIEPAPEEVVAVDEHHIRGVAKLEARLIILLDLHRVLAHELQEGSGQARP